MKKRFCAVGVAGLLLLVGAINLEGGAPSGLSQKIHSILSVPAMKGIKMGIVVVRLNDGAEIFSLNPDQPLIPASNMKLLTTASALITLKPEYRFKTTVYGDTPILDGKIEGNLYLKGGGDPFLVSEEMWRLVQTLHGLGLREVSGDLVTDDSFFDAERRGPGWGNNRSSRWYDAEISALSFNFNTIAIHISPSRRPGILPTIWTDPPQSSYIQLQNRVQTIKKGRKSIHAERINSKNKDIIRLTGTLPVGSKKSTEYPNIRNATRYTGVSFVDFMKREKIAVHGQVKSGRVPKQASAILVWKSKPLVEIVSGLNKFSNNFTAESILKTMGAEIHKVPGTTEKGLKIVRKFLQDAKVKVKSLILADGSGLSRQNRLSARALVKVLTYMFERFEYRPEFIASLATYGLNGTLKKRKGGPTRFIRAKSGRIKGVSALSGYIGKGKEVLAFSILMNDIQGNTQTAEAIQGRICRILENNFEKEPGD